MSKPNLRQKQKRDEQLREEMRGILSNPFEMPNADPAVLQEVKLIGAILSRIFLPADTPYPEVDIVLPTTHVFRIAKQWHAQGLRVHPELATVAIVIDDGNPKLVEVQRDSA